MPFLVFLKSFEDLLYEIMSWLVFYPRTLWRSVRHPMQMMSRGEQDLSLPASEQFRDILSPPIFLLLTILLAHGLAVVLVGDHDLIASNRGLARLIRDDTSLILFRIVAFAAVPVIAGAFAARIFGRELDRVTLQPMFYAQCFATTPVVLFYSSAGTLSRLTGAWLVLAEAMLLAASLFYLAVEASWFRRELKRGWLLAIVYAGAVFLISSLVLGSAALLFAIQ
ncbi:MAG: hypothetical protein ABIW03_05225 [Sphingomicrobium sp.]